MYASAFQMLPVPGGVSAQYNCTGSNQDYRGRDRTAKGAVQRFVVRNDRERVEHAMENNAGNQALPFVEKDDQRKADEHCKDDLADGFRQILPVQQIHDMPDTESDR